MTGNTNKLQGALTYIEANLDTPLTVKDISQQAGISPFHFHRLFRAQFRLSLYDLIKLLRLKRAAFQLAYRDEIKVIDIALTAQYQSPEAFSRAFLQVFGQSPRAFRKQANWAPWQTRYDALIQQRRADIPNTNSGRIGCVYLESIRIAYLSHLDEPSLLGETLNAFIHWRKRNALGPHKSRTFNLIYQTSKSMPNHHFRLDIACEFHSLQLKACDIEAGLKLAEIPAGNYARLRHIGSDDELEKSINHLYQYCLDDDYISLKDVPPLLERVRFFPDVPECESITDIYFAIEDDNDQHLMRKNHGQAY